MSDINELNALLNGLGYPSYEELAPDDLILITSFLKSKDPVFLLGIVMNLIKHKQDAKLMFKEHFKLRNEFNKFHEETAKIINDQIEHINHYTKEIESLRKELDDMIQFSMTENADGVIKTH